MLQSQRIEAFRAEDLATSFCGEVVFVPRCIIVFSQFIMNSGFGYNLSVIISILLSLFYYSGLIGFAPWFYPLH